MTRAVAAALLASSLAAPAALAARLPDWAQRVAETAPPLPDAITEHDSRILLQETRLSIGPDGDLRVRRRTASQALSSNASEVGVGFFPFDDDTRKVRARGWHLLAQGKIRKSSNASEMDLTLGDVFLTDAMTRVVAVSGVDKGSLVFFEFESAETPQQLAYQELFFSSVPTVEARVIVELPEGWQTHHAWLRQSGPPPVTEDRTLRWQLRDLEVLSVREELAPSALDLAPLLQVTLLPPDGVQSGVFRDWSDVGSWFEDLAAGRDAADDTIRAALREAIPDDSSGTLARTEAAARFVRDRVRYIAKEIGISGYQPRPAAEVLSNLYGDCKDKGTLLRAMLAAQDQVSYPILVNVSRPDTVSTEVPSLHAFNHFIVGVPVPEGAVVPDRLRPAVVRSDGFGDLLVIDTTNEYASIGSLSADLGGKLSLVVAGDRSSLVRLPDDEPSAHGMLVSFDAALAGDGSVSLTFTEELWGEPAIEMRATHAGSSRDFVSETTLVIERAWTGSKLDELQVTPETAEGRFVVRASVSLPALAEGATSDLLRIFPGALRLLPRTSLTRRTTPVEYRFPRTLRVQTRIDGVPESFRAPQERTLDGEGWSIASHHRLADGVLESDWELRLSERRFEPPEFPNLQELWSAARRSSRVSLSRKRR